MSLHIATDHEMRVEHVDAHRYLLIERDHPAHEHEVAIVEFVDDVGFVVDSPAESWAVRPRWQRPHPIVHFAPLPH